MAIKVIVELKAKPGQREKLKRVFERMLAEQEPTLNGFLGSARYEVLDDPDMLVEIADWESVAASRGSSERLSEPVHETK